MRLSLVGIGAVLAEKDATHDTRADTRGARKPPASLNVGIASSASPQGERGVLTDVPGLASDDTVALIRGTPIRSSCSTLLPADAGPDGNHNGFSRRKTIACRSRRRRRPVRSIVDGKATRPSA